MPDTLDQDTLSALQGSVPQQPNYDQLFASAAQKYNVDPLLLRAIAQQESGIDPNRTGPTIKVGPDTGGNAYGLMQIAPSNVKRLGLANPLDPATNINAGAQILSEQLAANKGDLNAALAGYSGGATNYANNVLGIYGKLGGKQGATPAASAGTAPSGTDLDSSVLGDLSAMRQQYGSPTAAQNVEAATKMAGDAGGNIWSRLQDVGHNLLLGADVSIMGGINAARAYIQGQDPSAAYSNTTNALNASEKAWQAQHPGASIADMFASVPGTGAAIGATEHLASRILPEEVSNFLLGKTTGLAGIPSRLAHGTLQGAISTGATEGLNDSNLPLSSRMPLNMMLGAGVASLADPVVNRLYSPFNAKVTPEVAQAGQALANAGVDIKGSQLAQQKGTALMGAATPEQQGQFTGAVAKTINPALAQDTKLTPDVLNSERTRIGNGLNSIAARTGIDDTNGQMLNDLAGIDGNARRVFPVGDPVLAKITHQIDNVINETIAGGGKISGQTYQTMTRSDGPIGSMLSSSDAQTRLWGKKLRDAVDDGLERSSAPADVTQIQQLRGQYKNLMSVRPATDSNTGLVNPQRLENYVADSRNNYGMIPHGQDQLVDLARAGKLLPAPTPTGGVKAPSGLGGKLASAASEHPAATFGAGLLGTGAIGEAVGQHLWPLVEAHPMGALALGGGGALLAGLRHMFGSVADSPGYRNLLIRNALAGTPGATLPAMTASERIARMVGTRPNMLIPAVTRLEPGSNLVGGDRQ